MKDLYVRLFLAAFCSFKDVPTDREWLEKVQEQFPYACQFYLDLARRHLVWLRDRHYRHVDMGTSQPNGRDIAEIRKHSYWQEEVRWVPPDLVLWRMTKTLLAGLSDRHRLLQLASAYIDSHRTDKGRLKAEEEAVYQCMERYKASYNVTWDIVATAYRYLAAEEELNESRREQDDLLSFDFYI